MNEAKGKKPGKRRKPFHEEFSEKIIGLLERELAPWQKPWEPARGMSFHNPVSGTVYKGVNRLNLAISSLENGFDDPRWMTMRQANEQGFRIRRGSKSTTIVYYSFTRERDRLDDAGRPILGEDGKPERETVLLERPMVRFSRVFNGSQVDGLPPLELPAKRYEWEPQERAEALLKASGAVIKHDQADRAFYRPSTDEIHLPPRSSFDAGDKYYATALHELGHWTGHASRLDREFGPRGSQAYAREELRAEIASWMLGEDIGVGHDPGQHAAYVQSWIQALKEDPHEIIHACRAAEHIRDYVLEMERELGLGDREPERGESLADFEEIETGGETAERDVPQETSSEKTWLTVAFRDKNEVKRLGARWDRERKQWYAPTGTDLEPLSPWLSAKEVERRSQQTMDPQQEFARKLEALGLDLRGELPVLDGRTHRVPVLAKNGKGLDGAYCLHGDGIPAGWAQNHITGELIKLRATGVVLAPEERERQQRERAERLREAEAERRAAYEAAASRCKDMWDRFGGVTGTPYLEAKGVDAFGLKQDGLNLIIPVRNVDGEMRGFQAIAPDGQKAFARGIEKKGNFHLIGGEDRDLSQGEILLCEGYATGASLHMATDMPVAVAFDAGNLRAVAEAIRERHPNAAIIICADNDHTRENNVGVEKAKEAAQAVGGIAVIPDFSREEKARGLTDFNDLHRSRGLSAVRDQVAEQELER